MAIQSKFPKYTENLSMIIDTDNGGDVLIQSYSTIVAKVEGETLKQLGWWSKTTQKHINYAAKELGLELVK
jgi:hypothetical protein